MEVVLKKKPKKELLDFLAQSSQRVSEEIELVEKLYEDLLRKGQSNPFLKNLIDRLIGELRIPEPPLPPEADKLPRSLEEYEKNLRSLEENLREILKFLDKVEKILPEVESGIEKVEKTAELLKPINPSLVNTAYRQVSKVRRIQELVLNDPKPALLIDLEKGLEDIERTNRVLLAEYEKTLDFIQRDLNITRELVEKALSVTMLQDRSILTRELGILDELARKINELKMHPQPFETREFYSELDRIKRLAQDMMQKSLTPEEIKVFEAISWLRSGGESKVLDFAEFVEMVSRKSGVPWNQTLEILYKLSKARAVKLVTRILS